MTGKAYPNIFEIRFNLVKQSACKELRAAPLIQTGNITITTHKSIAIDKFRFASEALKTLDSKRGLC